VKGLETAAVLHNMVSDEKFSLGVFLEPQKQKYFRDTKDGTTKPDTAPASSSNER
jgi:hypothetical protein